MGLEIPMLIGGGMGLLSGGGLGGALKGAALGGIGGGIGNMMKSGSLLNAGASAIPATGASGVASATASSPTMGMLPPTTQLSENLSMMRNLPNATQNLANMPTQLSEQISGMRNMSPIASPVANTTSPLMTDMAVGQGGMNASNAVSPYSGFKLPDYVTPQNVIGAAGLLQNMQGRPQQAPIQSQGAGILKGNTQGLNVDMGGAKLIKRRGQQ